MLDCAARPSREWVEPAAALLDRLLSGTSPRNYPGWADLVKHQHTAVCH